MRVYILAAVGLFVAGAALGRYTAPAKVTTTTKVVEQTQIDKNVDRHKVVVLKEIIKPDGTKVIVTKTTSDTEAQTHAKTSVVAEQTRVQENNKSLVTLSALVGTSLSNFGVPIYGASITKSLLGPITMGVWGMNNGSGGLSVGLSF